MKKISLRNLQKMIEERYISVQKHPMLDLWIYNYTQNAQFDRLWNNETLSCRGLIMDAKHNIIARPFKKFFNMEELEGQGVQLPLEDFQVFDKLDGSLGILYWVEDTPYLATRGSFSSDQAIKGTEILHRKIKENKGALQFEKYYTYLFEILYPQNRVVVDYGKTEDIVLLTVINTITGTEKSYSDIKTRYEGRLSIVKRYDGITDYKEFASHQKENSEGYVIMFKDGLRIKIKFEEYKRLHKLLTGVNARTIWEALRAGESIESMCYRVPDEFYQWIQKAAQLVKSEYRKIEVQGLTDFSTVEAMNLETRKEKAMEYQKYDHPKMMFLLLDGRDYREYIWKMIKPPADKPFKPEEAEQL